VTDAGQINAHTHIYSGLAPFGMPQPREPPENFVQILERVWWRLDRALDERSLAASARWYVAESLLSGTTTLVDHHESPEFIEGSLDVLADACDELGMRALLCYGATERNGGRDEARRGLAECRRFLETNRRPHVRGVVGLHASFTVSDTTIREAGAMCRELGTVLHVHVAEDRADVEDARRRGFEGPLERLRELGALPEGSILAHGVWLEPDEVRLARDLGCWIVQNPRSNRGNRVGYPEALGESDRVALGTDGYPSDLDEEERVLRDEARAHGEGEAVLRRRAGAASILVAERFGPQAVAGDRVVREANRVRDVTVAGRAVVRGGELATGDREAIVARARAEAPRLWQRMLALGPRPG
jgi:cytosine/adenosine deaminase-related metal-dependent hydrolase